jgi:hypothetical protein
VGCGLIAVSVVLLSGCGGGGGGDNPGPVPLTVPKASCGPNDKPETVLQGQVPASLRANGFKGFSCNLQLLGQSKNEGASWQHAWFQDGAGHLCAYYDTATPVDGRVHPGTAVLDVSDPFNPTPTTYLSSVAMLDPWESLRTNVRRQLLAAESARAGKGGPEFEV